MKTIKSRCHCCFTLLLLSCFLGNAQNAKHFNKELQFYPVMYKLKPDISSPSVLEDGTEIIIAHIKNGKFAIVPVTVGNGESRNYIKNQWGKGNQLEIGCDEFQTLSKTGLHSVKELKQTKVIGGKTVEQITKDGRPGNLSSAGFMAADEDIISVFKSDNELVKKLGFTHPDMAKPLFNVFNLILEHRKAYLEIDRAFPAFDFIFYNGHKIYIESGGAKGWQTSIFNDGNLGYYWIKLYRDFTGEEIVYLKKIYSNLTEVEFQNLTKNLSEINTGEMVPFYIMRYGFYEGHTAWRADPVAISFIFGLKSLSEIDKLLNKNLYNLLK